MPIPSTEVACHESATNVGDPLRMDRQGDRIVTAKTNGRIGESHGTRNRDIATATTQGTDLSLRQAPALPLSAANRYCSPRVGALHVPRRMSFLNPEPVAHGIGHWRRPRKVVRRTRTAGRAPVPRANQRPCVYARVPLRTITEIIRAQAGTARGDSALRESDCATLDCCFKSNAHENRDSNGSSRGNTMKLWNWKKESYIYIISKIRFEDGTGRTGGNPTVKSEEW